MTVEEALVALLAAVAGILLFVGLSQALGDWRRAAPDEPRGPRRAQPTRRSATAVPAASAEPTEASTKRPPRAS